MDRPEAGSGSAPTLRVDWPEYYRLIETLARGFTSPAMPSIRCCACSRRTAGRRRDLADLQPTSGGVDRQLVPGGGRHPGAARCRSRPRSRRSRANRAAGAAGGRSGRLGSDAGGRSAILESAFWPHPRAAHGGHLAEGCSQFQPDYFARTCRTAPGSSSRSRYTTGSGPRSWPNVSSQPAATRVDYPPTIDRCRSYTSK